VDELDVAGKRVLVRVDFNVPLDDDGRITNDRRIEMALPTIGNVLERGGRAILMSHLGRPKGQRDPKASLAPTAARLGELLGLEVGMAPDCIGEEVKAMVDALGDGQALVLENLRFHEGEEKGEADFSRQLASLADLYVNDAFGTCHREHASMVGVPEVLGPDKCAAGFLVRKEITYLSEKVAKGAKPFVMIMGGAKVSDKIGVIEHLLEKIDTLLIGGAMSYTFMKAAGLSVGNSLVEEDKLTLANDIRAKAAAAGVALELPDDFVCGDDIKRPTSTQVAETEIPAGQEGFDIGPKTAARYANIVASARTIVWNGPVGVFETEAYRGGTEALARAVAEATRAGAVSIIGGGDSAAAMELVGVADQLSHISTGGGASLELLEGKRFRSLEVLG
jgi:phosphoglycerate kinase